MARGRKTGVQKVHLAAWIPETLSDTVDLILLDPARNRVTYGAKSALIEHLLTEWVERKQKEHSGND